ncbi:MAG: hypothetical protein HY554_03235 [Elusimicrobia bacterium]|nr:hypothetical protein [Elusimicrobiota bacterium]
MKSRDRPFLAVAAVALLLSPSTEAAGAFAKVQGSLGPHSGAGAHPAAIGPGALPASQVEPWFGVRGGPPPSPSSPAERSPLSTEASPLPPETGPETAVAPAVASVLLPSLALASSVSPPAPLPRNREPRPEMGAADTGRRWATVIRYPEWAFERRAGAEAGPAEPLEVAEPPQETVPPPPMRLPPRAAVPADREAPAPASGGGPPREPPGPGDGGHGDDGGGGGGDDDPLPGGRDEGPFFHRWAGVPLALPFALFAVIGGLPAAYQPPIAAAVGVLAASHFLKLGREAREQKGEWSLRLYAAMTSGQALGAAAGMLARPAPWEEILPAWLWLIDAVSAGAPALTAVRMLWLKRGLSPITAETEVRDVNERYLAANDPRRQRITPAEDIVATLRKVKAWAELPALDPNPPYWRVEAFMACWRLMQGLDVYEGRDSLLFRVAMTGDLQRNFGRESPALAKLLARLIEKKARETSIPGDSVYEEFRDDFAYSLSQVIALAEASETEQGFLDRFAALVRGEEVPPPVFRPAPTDSPRAHARGEPSQDLGSAPPAARPSEARGEETSPGSPEQLESAKWRFKLGLLAGLVAFCLLASLPEAGPFVRRHPFHFFAAGAGLFAAGTRLMLTGRRRPTYRERAAPVAAGGFLAALGLVSLFPASLLVLRAIGKPVSGDTVSFLLIGGLLLFALWPGPRSRPED